jgi:HlyD family secretion protein
MKMASHNKLLITVILFMLLGCEKQEEIETELYETESVSYRSIDISVEAAGIVEPETTVEVKSKASGEILVLNAETGDSVEEGTLLVQIDKRTPRNSVDQTSADLEAAIARRKIAQTQIDRTRSLLEKGIVTDTEYETAELELANAQAQVISRQVGLENSRIAMDDTDIKAPISGIIIEKNVERGQVISSPTQDVGGGTILLKMADLSSVLVRTQVDETDIGKIKSGFPVTVTVAAFPNQPFQGVVLKIEPQATVEQNVTRFPVIIRLSNENDLLKPGMNAEVKINIAHADNVLAVPTIALRSERDIATTANVLGISDTELRSKISGDTKNSIASTTTTSNESPEIIRMGGREITLPPGVDADVVRSAMEKRRNNQTPTTEEKEVMQKVFQSRNNGNRGRRQTANIDYQYGGEYWVLVVQNETLIPRKVKTGITDLEYSEVVDGLNENENILILPSSGLIERQVRMQERLNSRMSLPGMGN